MKRSKKPGTGTKKPPSTAAAMPVAICAAVALSFAVSDASANADCAKDVAAAFEKQRAAPGYLVVTRQPGPSGEITITRLLQQPDRMHNKVEVPGQPGALETIAIGRWAWANQGGGFQELWPQFAQAVTSDVTAALREPVSVTEAFTCAGSVEHDGRSFTGYRTVAKPAEAGKPAGPENPLLVRTVLVDPATGLPAYNLVGEPGRDGKPDPVALMRTAYSYPAEIKIEKPDAVPAGRPR